MAQLMGYHNQNMIFISVSTISFLIIMLFEDPFNWAIFWIFIEVGVMPSSSWIHKLCQFLELIGICERHRGLLNASILYRILYIVYYSVKICAMDTEFFMDEIPGLPDSISKFPKVKIYLIIIMLSIQALFFYYNYYRAKTQIRLRLLLDLQEQAP